MDKLLAALPLLGCLLMCPLMMIFMMRGKSSEDTTPGSDEAAKLRAEVDQLRSELSQRDDATR